MTQTLTLRQRFVGKLRERTPNWLINLISIQFPWKLVRDHVPAIIRAKGGVCITRQLSGKAYRRALTEKLVEEAMEVANATSKQNCIDELADLQTVIDALRVANSIPLQDIDTARRRKDTLLGQFGKGFRMYFVAAPPRKESK